MSFFDHIYSKAQEGTAFIVVRDQNGDLNVQASNKWPQDAEYMKRYCEIRADEDVYYSVSVFPNGERNSSDTSATTKIVWADADICRPETFRLEPSIIVQTSPPHSDVEECDRRDSTGKPCKGHFHCLWELDKPYPATLAQEASKAIAYAHRGDGCDVNGWTLAKILRVPNTSNTKYTPPYHIEEETLTGKVYSLEEIKAAYSDVNVSTIATEVEGEHPAIADDAHVAALEANYITPYGLETLYLNKPKSGEESWSERAYRLELDLFRQGATAEEVFQLARNSASNKYNPDNAGEVTQTGVLIPLRHDPDGVLWREVQRAKREVENEVVAPSTTRDIEKMKRFSYLTAEELEFLDDNPTFLDQYLEWALMKSPDHAPVFSRSLAWTVLASCYGSRVKIKYSWASPHPNFWCYILAQSTKDHKTTSLSICKELLGAVTAETGERVVLDVDFSPEGLTNALTERDGQVSTVIYDEVQDFFKELMAKQYRGGTAGRLAKFYDGDVPQRLLATKGAGTEKEAKTVFNFIGAGIFDISARVLKRDDFESGFLLRSMWAIADPRPYQRGDSDLPVLQHRDYADLESPKLEMVTDLLRNMSRYDQGEPQIMAVSPEAVSRINGFAHAMNLYAISSGIDTMERGVDRIRDAVAKCAALLSYHLGDDEIGDFAMMVAIRQGELWFRDFQRMLMAITSTDFGRLCDEVENFIAQGREGQRANSEIYKKFTLKPNEFNEITQSLRFQGRIRNVSGRPGYWEVLS